MQGFVMSLRWCLGQNAGTLIVADEAFAVMLRFRQTRPRDREAGGQLFARFDGPNVHIVKATPPTLLDWRSRYGFRPNRQLQRRQIAKFYARGLHFVGDWHTHPESHPTPSTEDIASTQDCFRRSKHDLAAILMVVLGTAQPPDGYYVGLVDAAGIRPLTPCSAH
jgi:integrative and conjugative element protein (TIGR02256 family)